MNGFHRLPILLLLSVLPLLFVGCKKDVRRRLSEGARYVKSNPDKAIEILDGVLKDKPDEFMAVYYKGLAYRYKKDWPNAETWLFLAGSWISMTPATSPPARRDHSLVTRTA